MNAIENENTTETQSESGDPVGVASIPTVLGRPVPQSKQEWLNLLIDVSASGGFPSLAGDKDSCAYRGRNGTTACAVGWLIPDSEYNANMEESLSRLMHGRFIPEWLDFRAAEAVQRCHDDLVFFGKDDVWDHDKFVTKLREGGVFSDCIFPDPTGTYLSTPTEATDTNSI